EPAVPAVPVEPAVPAVPVEPAVPAVPVEPAVPAMPAATDPVCGMSVAAVPASLRLQLDGRTWYFCGPGCRQAFADDPRRYLESATG
ncbi:MAG TPA: YHS domain-containing protein, partial [Micromonosporaceae bacterium]